MRLTAAFLTGQFVDDLAVVVLVFEFVWSACCQLYRFAGCCQRLIHIAQTLLDACLQVPHVERLGVGLQRLVHILAGQIGFLVGLVVVACRLEVRYLRIVDSLVDVLFNRSAVVGNHRYHDPGALPFHLNLARLECDVGNIDSECLGLFGQCAWCYFEASHIILAWVAVGSPCTGAGADDDLPLVFVGNGVECVFACFYTLAGHFHIFTKLDLGRSIGTCAPYMSVRNDVAHYLAAAHRRTAVRDLDVGDREVLHQLRVGAECRKFEW